MNISDLEPMVQCEILRLAHDYTDKQRDELRRRHREPHNETKWYADNMKAATESLVSLYKQPSSK